MKKSKPTALNICIYALLIILAILQIFPFYFTIIRSFQPESFFERATELKFLPESWNFENYPEAWRRARLGRGYLNSLFYVSVFTFISAMIAMMVGYVLAKKEFRGKNFVFLMFLSTLMVPYETLLIPNFLMARDLYLTDKLAGLIIPGLVSIMGIFIAKQFMETIPDSIVESSVLDGAGEFQIFYKIIMPMSKPALATYCILTFTDKWNEYIWPLIILNEPSKFPVQLSLLYFVDRHATGDYLATLQQAAIISTLLPVVIIYFIFQKKFVEGISITGLK